MKTWNNYNSKVSVLIPIYEVEKYIEKCAHSLFAQTFDDIEYIFINDCSTDKSIEILNKIVEEYPSRKDSVIIINHEKNYGVGAARKTALKAAHGEYFIFIDSDDYIELDMISLMYNKGIETSADIILCPIIFEYLNGAKIQNKNIFFSSRIDYINFSFSQPSLCNKLFRSSLFKDNEISFLNGINYGEDLILTPQLFYYATKFAIIEKPLYHYIQYNTNSYTKTFSDNYADQTIRVVDFLTTFFLSKPDHESFSNSIIFLKALRKAKILRSGKIEKKFIMLYPEINPHLMNLNIDFKTKVILKLSALRLFFPLKIFVNILLRERKVKNHTNMLI